MPKDHWLRAKNRDIGRRERRSLDIEELERKSENRRVRHIPAGTVCHVRKLGSKAKWKAYATRKAITCVGHLWRNEHAIGLAYGDWELKVAVSKT